MKDPYDQTQGLTDVQAIIPLNERGLDARRHFDAAGFNIDTLDENGLFKIVRLNSNVIETVNYWLDLTLYSTVKFDTPRLNIPNKYPFEGKEDKNLRTQYIAFSPNATYYKPGELYRVNYYYEFDRYGRVTRMMGVFHNDYNSRWPYLPYGANYFVYDCS